MSFKLTYLTKILMLWFLFLLGKSKSVNFRRSCQAWNGWVTSLERTTITTSTVRGRQQATIFAEERKRKMSCCCLRPSAKDQGITWVVHLVVLHHMVHFLFKRNLNEKNYPWLGNELGPSAPQPSTLSTELQPIVTKIVKNYLYN